MQPTLSSVHVDAVLSNISTAYMQDEMSFIAGRVFPIVPVEKKTDVYYTYNKNDFMRDEMQRRAPGDESAGSGYGLSTASYSCDVFALHKDIDDQTRANSDNPLNPDRDATMFLTQQALIKREKQWVSDYFTTSVWATDKTGGSDFTVWSDFAGSDPIGDVDAGITAILKSTGRRPNTLVLGFEVYQKLKRHPDIIDLFYKASQGGMVSTQMMASIWDLDNVYISQAVNATNNEGETAAYGFVQGKHALLAYVNQNPGLLAPSAGYVFSWTGVSGGLNLPNAISRFRIDERKSDRIEIEAAWDNKVVGTDLGYFFSGCVA